MHLGFDDIHASAAGILECSQTSYIIEANECGHHSIQHTFKYFISLFIQHGIGGHQVTNISNQHQGTSGEHHF